MVLKFYVLTLVSYITIYSGFEKKSVVTINQSLPESHLRKYNLYHIKDSLGNRISASITVIGTQDSSDVDSVSNIQESNNSSECQKNNHRLEAELRDEDPIELYLLSKKEKRSYLANFLLKILGFHG